ncbi:hypothetical protein FB567DRAFT_561168 [Paraphoma chrysanthemicola]|uniref:Uncharacterized protein n=1 Tax=Paraphoma chrysanthemicola TaxID=798071 RepID=A0A8K0R6L1_9PLEO|nr:hypothetical protein FB567DRAFT_561168 [Paraphoma chrysanthemicola]
MYTQRPHPPSLKRSYSGESQSSYASAATNVSRASSKLLFGEIPLTPATTIDGRFFLRFWLNDQCRDNLLEHLETDDLTNMRLVCHDFSSRAAPRTFESITSTFRTSTFSKPARIEALSRIGRHIKTFTFHIPHTPDTFLPPIVNPQTGEEMKFNYEPQVQNPSNGPAKDKTPKYGSWEMQDLLVKQYPPLFHAATNVPAFVAAFSEFINLTHLKISCPGFENAPRNARSAVDYALISLRIAIERAPLYSLSALSLHPIHPGGLLYLHPMHGFGSTPSSAKRWGQIRRLSICMESIPVSSSSARIRTQSLEHLRILHAYLHTLSRSLTRLFFRWKGTRGPSPLSLDKEPCMLPYAHIDTTNIHPSLRSKNTSGPLPLKFSRLRHMQLENAVMDATQISDFITRHKRSLVEFEFEDVRLREGDWDQALEPLTHIAGSDRWKRNQEETMDVPIMLSPVDASPRRGIPYEEPRVMGPLLEELDNAIEEISPNTRSAHALSRWLGKGKGGASSRKGPAAHGKESWLGGEHVKRLLRLSAWK